MRRYIWPVLFFMLFILGISCTAGNTELKVIAESSDGNARFSYYSCTLERGRTEREAGSKDGVMWFHDLVPGQVDVKVSAISEDNVEYEGMSSVLIKSGVNTTEVILCPKKTETRNMHLYFPATRLCFATLRNEGNQRVLFQDRKVDEGEMDLPALPYGKYIVSMIVADTRKRYEYRFTCSEDSPEELLFLDSLQPGGETDFRIDLFDLSRSPIDGYIRITEKDDSIVLRLEIERLADGIRERDLEFLWFRNGIFQQSGKQLEFQKLNGNYRYDCILKSRFIGSYGSETINISISR